jgi:predicted CoA-binding protein
LLGAFCGTAEAVPFQSNEATPNFETRSEMNDPGIIDEMLHTAKTIAVVGMSDKTWRASNNIGRYLADNGYRVIPVNPALAEVAGLTCYPDLNAAQAAARDQTGSGIDLADVFRASEHVPAIVDDVIRLGIPYLWLQDGVMHEEAVARARAAGVKCIQNDCIFREHAARPDLHARA